MPVVPIGRHARDWLPRHEESNPPVSRTCAESEKGKSLPPTVTVTAGMRVSPWASAWPQATIGDAALLLKLLSAVCVRTTEPLVVTVKLLHNWIAVPGRPRVT